MRYLVISSSLNPGSNSRRLAVRVKELLEKASLDVDWLDLREVELPMCDGAAAYGHPNVPHVTKRIKDATCILLAVPIYNYDAGAAAKNLIELTGKAWTEKIVGFMCAAGGRSSYMSVMGLANSLMLDFRCIIIPRFVYAEGSTFSEGVLDAEIDRRLGDLVNWSIRLSVVHE